MNVENEDKKKSKWTIERVRKEIYDARTKVFVITKVLETGNINLSEHPEWLLVMRPLTQELVQLSEKLNSMMGDPTFE